MGPIWTKFEMTEVSAAVLGLGYVGMTLAVTLARRGVRVHGIETRRDVVDMTNARIPHFAENGLQAALSEVMDSGKFTAHSSLDEVPAADYYVITVGTPLVVGSYQPRLDMIELASRQVAAHMQDDAVVVLRSTVKIGTTRNVVDPILAASGKAYHLSMCPERTIEGDALRELMTLPQIVGGMDDVAADRASSIFSRLTNTLVRVASPETAEMIKLVDNTSRDVRFAFANEVARACDAAGISANEVIRFGKLGYARTNVALPGLVGGPCLEKDPHILIASVDGFGIDLEITRASRTVNERQPSETVAQVIDLVRSRGKEGDLKVAMAGLAFKGVPETDDLRGSMALKVLAALRCAGVKGEITAFDPVVPADELAKLDGIRVCDSVLEACRGADILFISNNHPSFEKLEIDALQGAMAPGSVIYDYWANLVDLSPEKLRGFYYVVGNIKGQY